MPTMVFWRDYGEREISRGTTVMAAAQRAGVPLGNACRSQGICRACAVLVIRGQQYLSPPNELERRMGLEAGWRMACQTRVNADEDSAEIVVWIAAWGGWPELEPMS